MFLPCERDYIQTEIIVTKQFYEKQDLKKIHKYVKDKAVCLDVGANIGNHSLYFASVLNAKKVYSFEPVKLTHSILKKNISLNKLEDVISIFECGLGSENTKAEIIYDGLQDNNLGGTALSESTTGDIEIRKLDDIQIPEKIDFIKIDVERMENLVLAGAKETIVRDKPILWIEIFEDKYETVSRILTEYGYKQMEILSGDNYLFIHQGNDIV